MTTAAPTCQEKVYHRDGWGRYTPCGKPIVPGSTHCRRHTPKTGSEWWYRIELGEHNTSTTITAKEFNGSTDSQLIRGTARENKWTQYVKWFKTPDEALAALIARAQRKVENAERALATARDMLARAEAHRGPGRTAGNDDT